MDLKEFVTQTLLQVLGGGQEAADKVNSKAGMRVKPHYDDVLPPETTTPIDFDVAVTVRETAGSAGSGRISVMGLGLGGEIKSEVGTESVTRVRFKVPVRLPGNHVRDPQVYRSLIAQLD